MEEIKKYIKSEKADAWVIYDYSSSNPAFVKLFGSLFLTRKCFVIIRPDQKNTIICHSIDSEAFKNHAELTIYDLESYKNWIELGKLLSKYLRKTDIVLMEISENGMMPRISYVDYGTVCLIQNYVKEVRSSADIFQFVAARLSKRSIEIHTETAKIVNHIKDLAFEYIFQNVETKLSVSEYEVQQFILEQFERHNLITDGVPIVAIGHNANNPHYEPTRNQHSMIKNDDLVLIDLWAKRKDDDDAVFADITWMGYVGHTPPKKMLQVFEIVKESIDKTLEFINETLPKRPVFGYEVDDICRNYINASGYGEYFVHRTGHSLSLGENDHGIGVNIDNFETHDTRKLIDGVAFSIEPGIYLPEFGVREEINVYIDGSRAVVSTPRQEDFVMPEIKLR